MFDTHCHLNFKAFKKILPDVIIRARAAGVSHMTIPGTDVKISRRAVEIAQTEPDIFSSVGIHPHHVYKLLKNPELSVKSELEAIESLIKENKVVAVGEVGLDYHLYEDTVYTEYAVNAEFKKLQEELFRRQIQLAIKHKKSLIIHNREAKDDLLPILADEWQDSLRGRTVFHCCEPDKELQGFAEAHDIYIGIDGDVTYYPKKQEFIKQVPLKMLVLETDSPYLLPEPLRTDRKYPNEPAYLATFIHTIANLTKTDRESIQKTTTENAFRLFAL